MSDKEMDELVGRLSDLLLEGRKIEAIKYYREMTGLGLKEAKEALDGIEASLKKENPEAFAAAKGKGCAAVFVGVLLCLSAMLYPWFTMA